MKKSRGCNPGILAKFPHHGLLIIPIHRLALFLCLLSINKLVCGGSSGTLWLPSHHPGGCCTLMVVEEITPLLCKVLWVPRKVLYKCNKLLLLGVDRLSALILSIFTIIDIGHFQNRFADNYYYFFIIMQTNILFTGDIIYWWINNTCEIIKFLNALFGSDAACLSSTLCGLEQSPPTAHLICREICREHLTVSFE